MGLEEVAANLLDDADSLADCAVFLDGDQVLVGYGYDASTHRGRVHGPGGVLICDSGSATLVSKHVLPQLELSPSLANSTAAFTSSKCL